MRSRSWLRILAMAAAVALPGAANADVLTDIKTRGALIAGVKPDYPPFGYRNEEGEVVGLEVDLARDIANRIGVPLRLMAVSASSRLQFLEIGGIDLVAATMAVTDQRAKVATLIEPPHYASAVGLLLANSTAFGSAADLTGKILCTIDGAHFNEALTGLAPDVTLLVLRNVSEAEEKLRAGECAAFADEEVRLLGRKRADEGRWGDYRVTPLDMPPLPWALGVQLREKDAPFGKLVAEAVTDWHRSGKLLELERKWLGQNTRWLLEKHEELKRAAQ